MIQQYTIPHSPLCHTLICISHHFFDVVFILGSHQKASDNLASFEIQFKPHV